MSYTITHTCTLAVVECCTCGTLFAMPLSMRDQLRESGNWFYCPNGHQQRYSETEVQKLKKQLDAVSKLHDAALQREVNALAEANHFRKARDKAEKKLKRADKGVCPCCNRTFSNLARHMLTQHAPPEERAKAIAAEVAAHKKS